MVFRFTDHIMLTVLVVCGAIINKWNKITFILLMMLALSHRGLVKVMVQAFHRFKWQLVILKNKEKQEFGNWDGHEVKKGKLL